LFFNEVHIYFSRTYTDRMVVDDLMNERLTIKVNISFFALNCAQIELVTMDASGEHQLDVHGTIHKHRLASDGHTLIAEKRLQEVNAKLPADYCGSCYGAESGPSDCCNSCADILDRYSKLGWDNDDVRKEAEQCKRDKNKPEYSAKDGEGCIIEGSFSVNKVQGNFHVALGKSYTINGRLVHQFNPSMINKYNTSHRVNHLSFGEYSFPSQTNPLNGVEHILEKDTASFQFQIKVITTTYKDASWSLFSSGTIIRTNQYSFTKTIVPILEENSANVAVLPGTFFIYTLSPFVIHRSEHNESFFVFVTHLCAIIGGVVSISRLIVTIFVRKALP